MRRSYLPDPYLVPNPEWTAGAKAGFGFTGYAGGGLANANNDAHYLPVTFPCDAVLYALRFAATNGTGNYDLGLYDSSLSLIASSGSTAMTAAGVKSLTLPEIRVRAGELVYAALALSSTSGSVLRFQVTTGGNFGAFGWGYQASALPLPATATPVDSPTAYTIIPVFAFGVR